MLSLQSVKKYRLASIILLASLLIPSLSFAMERRHSSEREEQRRRAIGEYHNEQPINHNFSFKPQLNPTATTILILLLAARVCCDIAETQAIPSAPGTCSVDGQCGFALNSQSSLSSGYLSSSGLKCKDQALQLGATLKTTFTSYERSFVHPGTYAGKAGIKTHTELQKLRVEEYRKALEQGVVSKKSSQKELSEILIPRFQVFSKIYGLDKDYDNNDPIDGTAYRDTLDWVERKILAKDKLSTILKTNQYISFLKETNRLINSLDKIEFRNGPVLIKSTSSSIPAFQQYEEMIKYLKNHDPDSLNLYINIAALLQSQFGHSALGDRKAWTSVIGEMMHDKNESYYEFLKRYYTINDLSPKKIQEQLEKTFSHIKYTFKKDPLRFAATLHQNIIEIHPFADGNGRTARIWMNIFLKKAGYPGIITHRDDAYTKAVSEALEKKNIAIFEDYMKDQICKITELHNNPSFDHGNRLEEIVETCQEECQEKFTKLIEEYKL